MTLEATEFSRLLDAIVDHIDIPRSYYEKAAERHRSLGEWLLRPESAVAAFSPDVSVQGSFRYGTVNRPIHADEEYDLDNVCVLRLSKTGMTQKELKHLYGGEIRAYAKAHGMLSPAEEHHRCWRLSYADEVRFHLDTLPCVPEDTSVIGYVATKGASLALAKLAVAITDRRHPRYDVIARDWHSSNPRGFAAWFEDRARPAAAGRMRELVEGRSYASVGDVPPYEWKTPLQRAIQLLKRHRDWMFRDNPTFAPISMIITNLSAHAYGGETDVAAALRSIVGGMPRFVRDTVPRVPNPADPAEDYADKWKRDPRLEENFWLWHADAAATIERLAGSAGTDRVDATVRSAFDVRLTRDELDRFGAPAVPAVVRATPVLRVAAAPKPWGAHG